MKKTKAIIFTTCFLATIPLLTKAVNPKDSVKYYNWHNMDPELNKVWGIGTDRAYDELLKNKKSKTVIVAVIDNGVDINHEDLKDVIWVNEDEIPDNGIDDDNNGYIDDIHGWNFLGNSDGENINQATLEVTRLYRMYNKIFDGMTEQEIIDTGIVDYAYYKKVVDTYNEKSGEYSLQKAAFENAVHKFFKFDSALISQTGKEDYTREDLKKLKTSKGTSIDSARRYMLFINKLGLDRKKFEEGVKYYTSKLKYHYNVDFYVRDSIIGDDPSVWSDINYGNNDVSGPDPDHGTMVSGVIAAKRNNNIGINGIADNVKIMVIRAVPDGDEWDKDVAKSIEYAIKNNADIINMSFGKAFSPEKAFVDSIARMADENNVLLIHAAGNESVNNDIEAHYPNQYKGEEMIINNWLDIGASAKRKKKKEFVADFSNYGKHSVDLFAPGENIYTTTPDNNYDIVSGTSFSSPVVAGAAALIKSYYPQLTAAQIKDVIIQSTKPVKTKVVLPSTQEKDKKIVDFTSLSATGGVINVYKCLLIAEEMTKE